jgi:hypothetical protein
MRAAAALSTTTRASCYGKRNSLHLRFVDRPTTRWQTVLKICHTAMLRRASCRFPACCLLAHALHLGSRWAARHLRIRARSASWQVAEAARQQRELAAHQIARPAHSTCCRRPCPGINQDTADELSLPACRWRHRKSCLITTGSNRTIGASRAGSVVCGTSRATTRPTASVAKMANLAIPPCPPPSQRDRPRLTPTRPLRQIRQDCAQDRAERINRPTSFSDGGSAGANADRTSVSDLNASDTLTACPVPSRIEAECPVTRCASHSGDQSGIWPPKSTRT